MDDGRQHVTAEAPVVWITGAGRPRLGQHLARDWAAAGARLVLHAHQSRLGAEALADELAAPDRTDDVRTDDDRTGDDRTGDDRTGDGQTARVERPLVVSGDLGDAEQVQRMVARVLEHFGRIDHLIHAAATWLRQPLDQLTPQQTMEEWRNNLAAPFWLCQQVGLQMVSQPQGGSIVVIGDWSCERPYVDHAAYLVAKGALPTLVRVFAVELSQRNPRVRVNGLLPGPVILPGDRDSSERPLDPAANLMGQGVGPAEISAAVRLLATNRAFQGACLPVHGGRDLV